MLSQNNLLLSLSQLIWNVMIYFLDSQLHWTVRFTSPLKTGQLKIFESHTDIRNITIRKWSTKSFDLPSCFCAFCSLALTYFGGYYYFHSYELKCVLASSIFIIFNILIQLNTITIMLYFAQILSICDSLWSSRWIPSDTILQRINIEFPVNVAINLKELICWRYPYFDNLVFKNTYY